MDSRKVKALAAALAVCPGRPIVNSVTGEEASLEEVLPLVKEYGVPVIGLTLDEKGIPADAEARVEIAHRIVERAEAIGIPREDVIIDCLTLSLGANVKAGLGTLEATRRVKAELGVNQTQGASNVSHGLPNRPLLTGAYLAMAIEAGLTCPTVDVAQVRLAVLSADLILGRDNYAMRFISAFREAQRRPKPSERGMRRERGRHGRPASSRDNRGERPAGAYLHRRVPCAGRPPHDHPGSRAVEGHLHTDPLS